MSVRQSLLALLDGGESYGYQLRSEFERRTGGTWPVNIGQVYSTLDRLERDGLVAAGARNEEGQRPYAITAAGREVVRTWFDEPVLRSGLARDELAMKLALAVSRGDEEVRRVIQTQRSATLRTLQDLTRTKLAGERDDGPDTRGGRAGTPDDIAGALVLESLIFQVEAEARWLDYAEATLTRKAAR